MIRVKVEGARGPVKDTEVELDPSQAGDKPLLDLLEEKGVQMAYGCRSGACGVCRVEVTAGLENLQPRRFVEEDCWARCQDPENIRLACQAWMKAEATAPMAIKPAPEVNLPEEPDGRV